MKNAGVVKKKGGRQPGWDATFSLPKSYSVLWANASPADREKLQHAVQLALEAMVEQIENEFAFSRTGRGGHNLIKSKPVAAAFIHGTSRALDPQYHVHLLLSNLACCEDGRKRTIVSKVLYDNKMLLGSMFRCFVAYYLQRELGLEIERPLDRNGQPRGWFHIKGVPEALCRAFSKRRKIIEKELGAQGLETAAAAANVTLRTRERKTDIPPRSELFRQWQEEGEKHGFTQQVTKPLFGRAKTRDKSVEYRKALTEALDRITSQDSYFTDRTLLTEVLNASQDRGIDPKYACEETRRRLSADRQFVELGVRKGQACYTTREVLNVEKELLRDVRSLHEADFIPVDDQIVRHVVKKKWSSTNRPKRTPIGKAVSAFRNRHQGFTLTSEQADAVRYLTQAPGRLKLISGLAGTGKTTMLRAAREAFEKQGYTVIGCATAGVAAKRLYEGSGIQSDTVRMRTLQLFPKPWHLAKHHVKQLVRTARKKPTTKGKLKIDAKTVLVVDEAGQVGTRDFALLAKAVQRAGGILIGVGDERQLASVEMGGAFCGILERFGGKRLRKITRQQKICERENVRDLSKGKAKEVIERYAQQGQLCVEENREKAREKLVADWKAAGGIENPADHLIFVGTNQEVDDYNDLAQDALIWSGKLDVFEGFCLGKENLFPGDRVIFEKKSRRLKIENGDMGTVVAIRQTPLGTDLSVRLDGEEQLRNIPVERVAGHAYTHVRRGYAFTTHKLQGYTVDHAYAHIGGTMTNIQMTYVQASRHRKSLRLYTDQNEAGISLTNLARENTANSQKLEPKAGEDPEQSPLLRQVERSEAKELAHDVLYDPEQEKKQTIQLSR